MYFNYALDCNDYSVARALLWGNSIRHLKKVDDGSLGHRVVHALIGVVELIPIIGQIASLFEMIIVSGSASRSAETPPIVQQPVDSKPSESAALVGRKIEKSQSTRSLLNLHACQPHEYRKQLIDLVQDTNPEQQLHPVELVAPKKPEEVQLYDREAGCPDGIQSYALGAVYYGFDSEGISDGGIWGRESGWGCAWRAIQTCLSFYSVIVPSFKELYPIYGSFANLSLIYKNKYPEEDLPRLNEKHRNVAPHDLDNGWAEPFVGQMVLHDRGIESELTTVNGIPSGCNAPHGVFSHSDPLKSFAEFKTKLLTHFRPTPEHLETAPPVMIDNGTFAMSIVGIGINSNETTLWIADPHIHKELNHCSLSGLYTVTLNEFGDKEDKPIPRGSTPPSGLHCLNFATQPWMVLFPGNRTTHLQSSSSSSSSSRST